MSSRFALRRIGDSRRMIMGIATLWIALFHSSSLDFLQSETLLRLHLAGTLDFLQKIGNCGVDIFLFLSGYGLYHSLSGNSAVLPFYRRRFRRVLPTVLLVSIPVSATLGAESLGEYCRSAFLYGLFLPNCTNWRFWYCSFLLALYLLYPLIHRVLRRFDLAGALGLAALSVLLTLLLRSAAPRYFYQIEIGITRITVFVLGAWVGKRSREGASLPGWLALPAALLLLGILYWQKHLVLDAAYSFLWRYLYLPPVMLLIPLLARLDEALGEKGLHKPLSFFGDYSLEIYLLYENLYLALGGVFKASDGVGLSYALPCFVMALLLALALKRAAAMLTEGLVGKATE